MYWLKSVFALSHFVSSAWIQMAYATIMLGVKYDHYSWSSMIIIWICDVCWYLNSWVLLTCPANYSIVSILIRAVIRALNNKILSYNLIIHHFPKVSMLSTTAQCTLSLFVSVMIMIVISTSSLKWWSSCDIPMYVHITICRKCSLLECFTYNKTPFISYTH